MAARPLTLMDRLFRQMFYRRRLSQFDLPEHRVGWRSRTNQEARFSALVSVADMQGARILDLGCGLGCLYGYLKGKGWNGDYTGIDLLEPMVKEARKRFPEASFQRRDIVRNPPDGKWDFVLMSGLFNHRVKDNLESVREVVGSAWSLTTRALAFNILRQESGWADPEMYYAKDTDLKAVAEELAPGRWKTVVGYLPEDITVHLYRF